MITNREIPGAVARRETWKSNSASAFHVAGRLGHFGLLPEPWRTLADGQKIDYVVWSYRTPIAWVTTDGVHVIPDVRYSVTTSRTQNACRSALNGPGIRSLSDLPKGERS